MADISLAKSRGYDTPFYSELRAECSCCLGSLSDPVMLKCLHNFCRSCIESNSTGEQTLNLSISLKCPVCGDMTERSALMSNGLLYNYKQLSVLSSELVYCNTCDAQDVAAVYWCADCCMLLCDSCYSWHNRFNRRHRSAEIEVARSWSLSQLIPAAQCGTHKRQMAVQCFTCRGPKCLLCCESCRASKHDLKSLKHDETSMHISAMSDAIRANKERLSHAVSNLQQKCQETRRRLHGACINDGDKILIGHKRALRDAVVRTFFASVGTVCVNLQRIWDVSTTVIGKSITMNKTAILVTRNITMLSVSCLQCLKLLNNGYLLKNVAIRSITEIRVSLTGRRKYWQENGTFSIDGSSPLTSDVVLRSCLGATHKRRAGPRSPLLFGQVFVSFRTPVNCYDLAMTPDGHVLLAAHEHGLLVYSDRGKELGSWKPETQSSGEDDEVHSVAALSDNRAAVGIFHAHLVGLIKRSEKGDSWLLESVGAVLQSPPDCLAVHCDLLAVAVCRQDEQRQFWMPGREVQLGKLSSGELLYTQSRDYDIFCVALTALCLVTKSRGRVKRNSGARPSVLDAFSHSGEFLWRYETTDEELMNGLCVSAGTWSRVYVAGRRRDGSNSRVMAIGGANGRNMSNVLSSKTHGLQLPVWLSLAREEQRTILAVLSRDSATDLYRTVSLYEAKIE